MFPILGIAIKVCRTFEKVDTIFVKKVLFKSLLDSVHDVHPCFRISAPIKFTQVTRCQAKTD